MFNFENTLSMKSGNVMNYEKGRDLAREMPRTQLVPIVSVLAALHINSEGRASIPELCDALGECFDVEKMMIYNGLGDGLAGAIDGNEFDDYSGHNKRTDIICNLFNNSSVPTFFRGERADLTRNPHPNPVRAA